MRSYSKAFSRMIDVGLVSPNDINKTILDYDENELYDLLLQKDIGLSAINQIIRLHNAQYPLAISELSRLRTNELRELVRIVNNAIDWGD